MHTVSQMPLGVTPKREPIVEEVGVVGADKLTAVPEPGVRDELASATTVPEAGVRDALVSGTVEDIGGWGQE